MSVERLDLDNWITAELSGISLGDKRLDRRLLSSASQLAACTHGTITRACEDWADAKATYRLFDNPKTTAAKIYAPHCQRTQERLRAHPLVLMVQDTTSLDYSHHPSTVGLGPLGTEAQQLRGLLLHTALALTPDGLPLGLLSQELWARAADQATPSRESRRQRPIGEKESHKWLSALSATVAGLPAGTRAVTVADREADLFELFAHARTLDTELLIRAAQDRRLCEPSVAHLWPTLEQQPVSGYLKVPVPKRAEPMAREAQVALRFTAVTLQPPRHLAKRLKPLSLYALLVQEVNAPAAVPPLQWLLLSSLPIHSLAAAVERLEWYLRRWQIELYHKVLKSGCQVEKSQLASAQRLQPLVALLSIIAWRLCWLTYMARHEPDAPCTQVLSTAEWQALYSHVHQQPPVPSAPLPTVRTVVRWIAHLGGFLARRRDGEPGVLVMWRGWQRLHDLTSAWLIFTVPKLVGKD